MSLNNFSWVIPSKLSGCSMPQCTGDKGDLPWLAAQGVRTLVSLSRPSGPVEQLCAKTDLLWIYHPIPDFGIPGDIEKFSIFVDELILRMENGNPVCIHCQAGVGRTGLVLSCVLGKYLSLSSFSAISAVRKVRPAIETTQQEEFIKKYLSQYEN